MASLDDPREVYYLRLQLLIVKHGTHVIRCKFDQLVPPNQLLNVLNNPITVKTLRIGLKNKIINQRQWSLLHPPSRPPKSLDFDITLLIYLLKNICGLDKKSKWWKCDDNSDIPRHNKDVVEDIVRIRNLRNKLHHIPTAFLEENEFESEWNLAEEVMMRLTTNCGIADFKRIIDDVKKLDLISEELRSIRVNTAIFLEEFQDEEFFVKTNAYQAALQRLKENNVVVLTGHPGEGKTTMAARLALSTTELRNCLVLKRPSDWRHVDLSLKIINTIIIDDIFGAGSLDEKMLGEWKYFLSEIGRAAKQKVIQVIITSRDYIVEESREELGPIRMFGSENVILLTSAKLSNEEKEEIFKSQTIRNKREVPISLIKDCVMTSAEEKPDVLFGFPECVSMFVRHNDIFVKGAEFFKKPGALFKNYVLELYKSRPKELQDKYLALVVVWSKEDKILSESEFQRVTTTSCHVKRVAGVFDREVDVDFLETIQRSLKSHVGGFLKFSEKSGQYAFSHNVIGDMVGFVITEKKPEQAIEICPRDFLVEVVDIEEQQENKVTLKERHYPSLAEKMVKMILRKNCNEVANISNDDFNSLKRSGTRQNTVEVHSTLDFGLIKHKAFKHKQFMDLFITYVDKQNYVQKMFQTPVMSMKGFFFDYGISMDQLDMLLLDYAWFIGARNFAMEIIQKLLVENVSPTISLLLAVHSRDVESVRYLLEMGTKVTGDAIYIAIHNTIDTCILQLLLKHPGTDVNDRGNALHGNYPLIVASRKGFTDAVKCLLQNGADPSVKNTANMTALHKAIIYRKKDIIEALVEKRAPLNVRGGKFKRTPLHIAVDMGDLELVKLFLTKDAAVLVKDHRGHYPIHTAAIRGHCEIVRTLLPVDRKSQEKHRISSYGKRSKINGIYLYHIAVWKKDQQLLKILFEMGVDPNRQDWYGQTALYVAIMEKKEAVVSVLLDNEHTDKNKGQKQGFTPLHAAIYKQLTDVALKLIPHSNVNARDKFGKTPLHCACETMDTSVIDCLLENGINVKMITKRGDTIFHVLRRKMSRFSGDAVKARLLERYFAMYFPDFVQQLPMLRNRSGITIEVSDTVIPSDTHRPPLQQFLQENRTAIDDQNDDVVDDEDDDDDIDDVNDDDDDDDDDDDNDNDDVVDDDDYNNDDVVDDDDDNDEVDDYNDGFNDDDDDDDAVDDYRDYDRCDTEDTNDASDDDW